MKRALTIIEGLLEFCMDDQGYDPCRGDSRKMAAIMAATFTLPELQNAFRGFLDQLEVYSDTDRSTNTQRHLAPLAGLPFKEVLKKLPRDKGDPTMVSARTELSYLASQATR